MVTEAAVTALIQKNPPMAVLLLGLNDTTLVKMLAGGVANRPPFWFSLTTKLNHAKAIALMEWISILTVSPDLNEREKSFTPLYRTG